MESISIDKVKDASVDVGSIAGGMVAANVLVKVAKQDNLPVNGLIAVGGLIGACVMKKNSALKMLVLGASVFGAMRCLTIGVSSANSLLGASGILPEGIKEKISQYLPQLNGIGNPENEIDINLDDDVNTIDIPHEVMGSSLGNAEALLT